MTCYFFQLLIHLGFLFCHLIDLLYQIFMSINWCLTFLDQFVVSVFQLLDLSSITAHFSASFICSSRRLIISWKPSCFLDMSFLRLCRWWTFASTLWTLELRLSTSPNLCLALVVLLLQQFFRLDFSMSDIFFFMTSSCWLSSSCSRLLFEPPSSEVSLFMGAVVSSLSCCWTFPSKLSPSLFLLLCFYLKFRELRNVA